MITIAAVLVLLVAVATAALPGRLAKRALQAGVVCLALTGMAFAFLFYGPKDYLVRYPFVAAVLHPYQIGLYSFFALILGVGIVVGVLARTLVSRFSARQRSSGD